MILVYTPAIHLPMRTLCHPYHPGQLSPIQLRLAIDDPPIHSMPGHLPNSLQLLDNWHISHQRRFPHRAGCKSHSVHIGGIGNWLLPFDPSKKHLDIPRARDARHNLPFRCP